jgi:hypothetical protein
MHKILRKIFIVCLAMGITALSCTKPKDREPELSLYVMSHCPFGIRAEDEILGFIGNFNNELKLHVYYIVSRQGVNTFESLHGPAELDEDLHQIAIQKLYDNKFYSYLACYNSSMNRDKCLKDNTIDKNEIDSFVQSGQAEKILNEDFLTTEKLGINASPTLFINSRRYEGPMQPGHIIRTACSDTPKLSYCKTLKPPVDVHITLLTGGWNNIYNPNLIKESLANFFYKTTVDLADANSKQGKELAEKFTVTEVPAMIFSGNVTMTTGFTMLQQRLKEVNGSYVDYMNDMGYRHLLNRPSQNNSMILFTDINNKDSVNACISIIKLLTDYKKNQYHPVLRVIGSNPDDEALKTAAIIEHTNKLPMKDMLSVLLRLYSSSSLKAFNSSNHTPGIAPKDVERQIVQNNAAASKLDIGQARFALLVNNTEFINAPNPSQSVGIFELSPLIGKMAFPAGQQPGKCSK